MSASNQRTGSPRRVVALRLSGDALRGRIEAVWAAGDAALPLDPAAPAPEVERLLAVLRPDVLVDAGGERALHDPPGVDEGVAIVVPTSGTTGEPKGVELTHAALDASARASLARIGSAPGDRWLCCVPLHHIAGLGVLVRSRLTGVPPLVLERFDAGEVAGAAGVAFVSLVPTMLARLLDAGADVARFRAILLGGGPVPRALVDRARARGANVVETYGMTETCGGCVYDGRALDGVDVRVDDDGAIALRGPTLMRGYRNRPDLTDAALRDGWFHTSDAGEIGAGGRLRVLGRLDDLILTGGKKVSPAEVEAVLREHPAIADAAVCGLPDAKWGERVVAVVVPKTAAPAPDDVRSWVGERLARYKAPREIILAERLPRREHGKVPRAALLAMLARRGATDAPETP